MLQNKIESIACKEMLEELRAKLISKYIFVQSYAGWGVGYVIISLS